MSLSIGTRLGPYAIVESLGKGGMGEVYRARDTRLDRTVAIKILRGQLADDPESRDRFVREARAVAAFNHPHICTLYDVGSQDGVDFLVMEYLEGETLAERLSRGPLPVEQAIPYALQSRPPSSARIALASCIGSEARQHHADRTSSKVRDFGWPSKWCGLDVTQTGVG